MGRASRGHRRSVVSQDLRISNTSDPVQIIFHGFRVEMNAPERHNYSDDRGESPAVH